jgi:hypothetical protein
VRWSLFLLLAAGLCVLTHAWLATWPIVPDLPTAFVAFALIGGSDRGLLLRAWLVGVFRDAVDPGSVWFYSAAYLLLAILYLPVRHRLFQTRWAAWASTGAVCAITIELLDGLVGGFGGHGSWTILAQTALTAGATVGIGWLLADLPRDLRPMGDSGA